MVGASNRFAFLTTLLLPLVIGDAACLTGCIASDGVKEAFGFTEGSVEVVYTPLFTALKIGSEFAGDLDADYNAETKQWRVKGKITSDPTGVIAAQGDRITENFLEGRRIEWAGKEAVERQRGENITNGINAASNLIANGLALIAGGGSGAETGNAMISDGLGMIRQTAAAIGSPSGAGELAMIMEAIAGLNIRLDAIERDSAPGPPDTESPP